MPKRETGETGARGRRPEAHMRALKFEEIHLGENVDEIPGGGLWGF